MDEKITASEALFGFMDWITARQEVLTISAAHDASVVADLVDRWCKVNNIHSPREGVYPKNITHPEPLSAKI